MVAALLAVLLLLAAPASAADLRLTAEAEPRDPYVQAQVRYTVRLYRRSSLQTGYFVDPEVPGAVTLLLGADDPVTVERDGAEWQMIERRYLLFPQRSGPLSVPAPVYSGRQVFVEGEALTLDVRPKPAAAGQGWWLPARDFRVAQEWRLPDPPLKPGEAVQRIVTLTAEGLTGAQLPSLAAPDGDGYRVRRARSRSSHELLDGRVIGRRVEHLVIVPEGPGDLDLPPVAVAWWDTEADRARRAEAPGRRLRVAGTPAPTPAPKRPAAAPRPTAESATDPWPVGLAALVLAGLGGLAWAGGRLAGHPAWVARRSRVRARRDLARACRRHDAAAARRALLAWAAARWPDRPGLKDLPRRLDAPDLGPALTDLEAAVYGGRAGAWDGPAFARRALPLLKGGPAARRQAADALPPLA